MEPPRPDHRETALRQKIVTMGFDRPTFAPLAIRHSVVPGRLALCLVALVAAAASLIGCTPRTRIIPHPGPNEEGLRFYRPKPYLLVAPEGDGSGRRVRISLEYLPDFAEEYAVQIRSGLGINATSVQLEDGWNLVALDEQLDAQVDEQIRAFADLIQAAGKLVPTSGTPETTAKTQIVVEASNVPLGFYEAVIACGPGGSKRLYGWKYVGFAPFTPCPLDSGGAECRPCDAACIYGLVFRNGVMVFEPLVQVGSREAHQVRTTVPPTASSAPSRRFGSVLEKLASQAAALINQRLGTQLTQDQVTAAWKTRGTAMVLVVRPGPADREVVASGLAEQGDAIRADIESAARQLTLESTLTVELQLDP